MYNHNKAQQSKNRVHISWDILYVLPHNIGLLMAYLLWWLWEYMYFILLSISNRKYEPFAIV